MKTTDDMPEYKATIIAPKGTYPWQILIRYYAPWGDGSPDGWKIPIENPQVMINGISAEVSTRFSFNYEYEMGHVGPGYDQHEQCLGVNILQTTPLEDDMEIVISGIYPQVGYLSATLYFATLYPPTPLPIEVVDFEMETFSGENPYKPGNPSVFDYTAPTQPINIQQQEKTQLIRRRTLFSAPQYPSENDGKINLFRPDCIASKSILPDDVASDGCSKGYLFAHKKEGQEVLILRVKVPTTFIHNDSPDTIFGNYQCQEYTVGSHITNDAADLNNFDFWTVSSRMLNDYIDENGYAYVFFAPDSYVQQQIDINQTPSTRPPVLTWGNYKGYLLGDPSYALIIRYKAPADDWVGNPVNAICYPNAAVNQPVTSDELGEYLPELYGDTFENFEDGIIGSVHNDQPWPAPDPLTAIS
ncbi:TPA: hypothetical protein RQO21_004357 [Klebsiella michiganensis]|nr:hypothetical protein [Klebsiella michiganensis]